MNKGKMNTLMLLSIEDKVHNRFSTKELEYLKSIIEVELYCRDIEAAKEQNLGEIFEEYEANMTFERVA